MLNVAAQIEHAERHKEWIASAEGFASVLGFEADIQVQGLGRLDIDLIWADANAPRLSKSKDRLEAALWMDLGPRLTLARLWVLGGYEIVRALDQKTSYKNPQVAQTKLLFERIRMPLAKLEAARKYEHVDSRIAMPIIHNTEGVGWLTNDTYFVTRRALADNLLSLGKGVTKHA